jgi:ribose transport system ATP-binding protein
VRASAPTSRSGSSPADARPPALKVEGLSKTFPGVRALVAMNLEVQAGSIHALVGQNGCGKSTLVKVLSGFHDADPGGHVWVDGEPLELGSGKAAAHLGLRFVFQDLGLVEGLSATDNVCIVLGYARTRLKTIDWQAAQAETLERLKEFDVDLDPRRPMSTATAVERTAVAIVRALAGGIRGRGLLVLDEPTAALGHREVGRLYALIRSVRDGGTAVLLISHRLDEVREVADSVSVMRAGRVVHESPMSATSVRELAGLIAGGGGAAGQPTDRLSREGARAGSTLLQIRGLSGTALRGVDLDLRAGEIVGVAGLTGSGREELPYAVAGTRPSTTSGQWIIGGRTHQSFDVQTAHAHGVVLVPGDRLKESIFASMSVEENISLVALDQLRRFRLLDQAAEKRFAVGWLERMDVRLSSLRTPIATLSGGNQQKVVLGRWLALTPRVLVMADPTAGVDIGARRALYKLLKRSVAAELAILVGSSDVQDLVELCDRVLVLRDGVIVAQQSGADISESSVITAMEVAG